MFSSFDFIRIGCFFFSDVDVFGILCGMFMGIKFAKDTFERVAVAVLRWVWNACVVASVSTRCWQRLWQSAYVHVEADYAFVCTQTLSAGHPLRGCHHFGCGKWYGGLYQRFEFTFFATILHSRASGKFTVFLLTLCVGVHGAIHGQLQNFLFFFIHLQCNRVRSISIKFYANWFVAISAIMHGKLRVAVPIYRTFRIHLSCCCTKCSKKKQLAKNRLPMLYSQVCWNSYKSFQCIYR